MTKTTTRSLLLAVAMLTMFAVAATSAQAAITPARTRISFTSTNTSLTAEAGLGGEITTCPTAELTVTTDSNGASAVGRVTFSRGAAGTTCRTTRSAESVTVSCPGFIALQDTLATSVRATNTSVDLVLLGNPVCVLTNVATGTITNVDPQTVTSCVTIRENTTVDVRCDLRITIVVGGRSVASGRGTFAGTFSTATNISIS